MFFHAEPAVSALAASSLVFGLGDVLREKRQSIAAFVRSLPTLGALLRSRRSTFDAIHCILPSNAVVGESVSVTVQAWDEYERLDRDFEGTFVVESTDPESTVPDRVTLDADDDGLTRLDDVVFETPGIHYLTLRHPETGITAVSNPVDVTETEPDRRIYWGDLHLHSDGSDGVGTMDEGFAYARDVMDLDVAAYTDHDTMGFFIPSWLQRWRMNHHVFDAARESVSAFHDPGEFVTLLGYEWTNQPYEGGHVNVYFDDVDAAELFDSNSPESNTPEKLWRALGEWRERTGDDVLTIPHHPAEEMYPFDFAGIDYDDELAPLVEVYSYKGSSELPGPAGNPKPITGINTDEVGVPGHYVQDAHRLGNRVGMLASSDYHGPLPGHSLLHPEPHLPHRSNLPTSLGWGVIWRLLDERNYQGGLAAISAPDLTRESVFESLRERSVYGTTQVDRVIVDFEINGTRLGAGESEVVVDAPDASRDVSFRVAGTAPIERVTVFKNNEPWNEWRGTADPDAGLDQFTAAAGYTDTDPVTGMQWDDERGSDADVYYLRVRQADGGMAWAGPLWVGVAE